MGIGKKWQTFKELHRSRAVSAPFKLEDTMTQLLTTALLALAVAGPALAQTQVTTEYFVVQDASTKKCTIVDKKPTTTTTTVVGDGVYKTRTEAETGMKTIKVCTN